MQRRVMLASLVLVACMLAALAATAQAHAARETKRARVAPAAIEAPGGPIKVKARWLSRASKGTPSGCTDSSGNLHCYYPQDIRQAYGVDQLPEQGKGQTIVLVDSYGSPKAAQEIQTFHDALFPEAPDPNFDQVFPLGKPNYHNANGNGVSGSSAAAGWAQEAALDIQWSYAIAPRAHIVLLAVPPAETLGVQGFPNLFKAMSWAVGKYPAGTVFSMSFGVSEPTFGGAAAVQTARFDKVFKKGIAKGDSFFASSGDDGTTGFSKQQKETRTYSYPTTGWPASSPYVTAVGGTQLQYGWTWDPQSDVPFNADGSFNPAYFNSTSGGDQNVVWNESWLPAATGGGPSAVYGLPSWQQEVEDVIGSDARGVPDISWNAAVNGGVLTDLQSFLPAADQGFYLFGGTSASSPQVAALTALANEARSAMGKGPIGDVSPTLYALDGAGSTDVVPVHQGAPDVASGDLTSNTLFDYNGDGQAVTPGSVAGWPTLDGWDLTNGFGTPWAPSYVAGLTSAK